MAETRLVQTEAAGRALSPVLWLRIAAVLGLLLVWQGLGASGLVYPGVLPSWFAIVGALGRFLVTPAFWVDLSVTALEVATALGLGAVAGILAGVALGTGGIVGRGLERYVQYLASTPKVVFLPLVLILFGIGPASKVALGAFACSFPMMLGTASAMRHVPLVYRRVAQGFQLSAWQRVRLVYLPAMLRPIISGLRSGLPYRPAWWRN
jgi:ABC-type nitrate/sulfonate/bicarbonate transport system permease component